MNHIRYAIEMLHTRQSYDVGAVRYDRLIIDKYLEGKATGFDPDSVISSLSFSSKIIPDNVELCHGASLTKGVISYQQPKGPANTNRWSKARPISPMIYASCITFATVWKTTVANLTFAANAQENIGQI